MELKPFSTRLPEELITRLKVHAVKTGVTMQEALTRILEEGLAKEKSK